MVKSEDRLLPHELLMALDLRSCHMNKYYKSRSLNVAICCILFLISSCGADRELPAAAAWTGQQQQVISPDEAEAVYEVLQALNNGIDWRQEYGAAASEDSQAVNLCFDGPHGLVCGADKNNVLHVVELNLGWLSDATNNPHCGPNASFSPALTRFPYLRKLFFYNCFTRTATQVMLPPFLWDLGSSLEELVFMRNTMLVGGLPSAISKLANLKRLILTGSNALLGIIPEELGELMMLEQLVLSRNGLTGVVPKTLGSLRKLRVLDLSWNSLVGGIPMALARGKNELQKLDLSHNELSGVIPPSVGKASSLELLDLSWNKLSGPIPDGAWACGLRNLRVLEMGHNAFNGSVLPSVMWVGLRRVVGVGMAKAGLKGRIPEAMAQMRTLRYLDLSGNGLEGSIPASLETGLASIFEMDLSGNRLQGMLPFSAEFVQRMGQNLKIAGNQGLCASSRAVQYLAVNDSSLSNWPKPSNAGGALASLQLPACTSDDGVQHGNNKYKLSAEGEPLPSSRAGPCLSPDFLLLLTLFINGLISHEVRLEGRGPSVKSQGLF